ncbi:N-acetyltransferase family protein [Bradyrhizobium japonicum]|uniref:GNAT family N-acetyltransferase n=1 Tax=Bradyrhizobium japonicum TaxID=375 RepID=UPI00279EEA5A|nr:GNAT family N-acetyltransferase [Bradyrhizobium japonicum]
MSTEQLPAALIRQAQRSDTNDLIEIYCSNGFLAFSPSRPSRDLIAATVVSYLDLLESAPESITFLVIGASTKVLGFSIARMAARRVWELQIGVHAAQRSQGIGGALMRRIFTEIRSRGPGQCEAIVHSNNAASIRIATRFFQSRENVEALPGYVKFRSSW